MIYLNLIGLALNFIGSILIAFSVVKNPGGANQMVNNKKIYLASVLLNKFRWGIGLFSLGFFLQFLSILL